MGESSRYSTYSERRLNRHKRSIPIQGSKEDTNKYFRCSNCGFIVDSEKSTLGGEYSGSGLRYRIYPLENTERISSGDPLNVTPVLDCTTLQWYVALELGADGEPKPISHTYDVEVSGGCPLCGTFNWK